MIYSFGVLGDKYAGKMTLIKALHQVYLIVDTVPSHIHKSNNPVL